MRSREAATPKRKGAGGNADLKKQEGARGAGKGFDPERDQHTPSCTATTTRD